MSAGARSVTPPGLIDVLRMIDEGRLPPPPIATLVGFRLGPVEVGRATFTLEPEERHYSPLGAVHGGILATLLDMAMGTAVHTTVPLEQQYTTLNLSVNYTGRVDASSGRIACTGWVTHSGRRVMSAEGRIERERDGKLLAHATSVFVRADDGDGSPGERDEAAD